MAIFKTGNEEPGMKGDLLIEFPLHSWKLGCPRFNKEIFYSIINSTTRKYSFHKNRQEATFVDLTDTKVRTTLTASLAMFSVFCSIIVSRTCGINSPKQCNPRTHIDKLCYLYKAFVRPGSFLWNFPKYFLFVYDWFYEKYYGISYISGLSAVFSAPCVARKLRERLKIQLGCT